MTYLYLSRIKDNYFIMNSSEVHSFKEPSCNYGLSCKLGLSYEELTLKVGGIYGRIAHQTLELDTLLKGCKDFKHEETNIKLNEVLSQYLASLDQIELASFDIQVKEAEHYLSSKGSYDSVILKSLASAGSISLDELASSILDKSKKHNFKLIGFKCMKDHIEAKLGTINSLEGFETFNIEDEITKYQNEIAEQKVSKTNDELLGPHDDYDKLPEIIEIIHLESKTNKDNKIISKNLIDNPTKLKGLNPLEKVAVSSRRRNAQ